MKANGKKVRAGLLAGVLAVAMVLTGTLAWRSMSQRTVNKFMDVLNPGGRVHDDFKGLEDKDVYAENFADESDDAPVFARIKLLEYMEMGEDAGINLDAEDRKVTPLVYANVKDTSTWQVYDPTAKDDPFRYYWSWTMGGQAAYLPTFNKNKDSLSVDVNGTYEGKGGVPYGDYVPRVLGDKVSGTAYYDADPDDKDEYIAGTSVAPGAGGVKDTNYTEKTEEHEVKSTLNSLGIMTMSQWKAAGSPVCNRWIYDDSKDGGGWFYWPEPIWPQTATGLLLNKVDQRRTAGERSYYAIEVVGQFSNGVGGSEGDRWGDAKADEVTEKGFYADGFSADAKALLDQAATVVMGKNGKWYLPQGNEVYKEILDDAGKLGGLVCAGADGLIGTDDDRTDVVAVEGGFNINGTDYCGFYLKPTAAEPYYRAALSTGELGAETDTRFWVIEGTFPGGRVTSEPVTSLVVKSKDNADQVKKAESLQFSAAVTTADEKLTNTDVVWTLEGSKDAGTTLSEGGLLTVGNEDAGAVLTVTATSKLDGRVCDSKAVTVVTDKTIVLDEIEYYVLKTESEANRALILAKDIQTERRMDPENTAHWYQSELFHWLNNTGEEDWLGQNPDLRRCAITTTIKTRKDNTADQWEYSTGKVFLLSEADVFGTQHYFADGEHTDAKPDDYTAGEQLEAPGGSWVANYDSSPDWWWLRSPRDNQGWGAGGVRAEGEGVFRSSYRTDTSGGVRPAAWVMLNGVQVAAEGDAVGVAPGKRLQFSAMVVENMQPADKQAVTWSVSGGVSGTSIDPDTGLLTVDAGEAAKTLTVTATTADGVAGSLEVLVADTMVLDHIPFYVLKREGNQALVLSVEVLERRRVDGTNATHWHNTELVKYLNNPEAGGWLYDKPEIRSRAIQTIIKTRTDYNKTTYEDCSCKVFLLSQADVYGQQWYNDKDVTAAKDDYTAGVQLDAPGGSWIATYEGERVDWTLRSPRSRQGGGVGLVGQGGGIGDISRSDNNSNIRPAMWIRLS